MAEGIVIIDKAADWTSMDVCAKLRGILKTKKVGHAGTLDPMATGVLPVFVGQATRGVSFAESGENAAFGQVNKLTCIEKIAGFLVEFRLLGEKVYNSTVFEHVDNSVSCSLGIEFDYVFDLIEIFFTHNFFPFGVAFE